MENNTTKRPRVGSRLKRTWNTKWILAWLPDTDQYNLMMKVPGTRQTYESVTTPPYFYDMDDLIRWAEEGGHFSPICSPTFARKKGKRS